MLVPDLSLNAFAANTPAADEVVVDDPSAEVAPVVAGNSSSAVIVNMQEVIPTSNGAVIKANATSDASFNGQLVLFVKKSSDKDWGENKGVRYIDSYQTDPIEIDGTVINRSISGIVDFNVTGLDKKTAYDYMIVYVDTYEDDAKALESKQSMTDKFETLNDDSVPTVTDEVIGRYSYKAKFDVVGDAYTTNNLRFAYYYKEKTAEDKEENWKSLGERTRYYNAYSMEAEEVEYRIGANLKANTAYDYIVAVSNNSIPNVDAAKKVANVMKGSFTTAADNRKPVIMDSKIGQTYYAALVAVTGLDEALDRIDNAELKPGEEKDTSARLVFLYKTKDAKEWTNGGLINPYYYGDRTNYVSAIAAGLEPSTEYNYMLAVYDDRMAENTAVKEGEKEPTALDYPLNHCVLTTVVQDSFTTLGASDRYIVMDPVYVSPYNLDIYFTVEGDGADGITDARLTYAIIEKGAEGAEWDIDDDYLNEENGAWIAANYSVEPGKTYTVKAVVSENRVDTEVFKTLKANGKDVVEADFTAPADERAIKKVKVDTGYNHATFNFEIVSNFDLLYELSSNPVVFYKQKDAEDWNRYNLGGADGSPTRHNAKYSLRLTELVNGEQYDYMIVLPKYNYVENPSSENFEENVFKKVEGTFATKLSDYTVSLNAVKDKIGYNFATVDAQLVSKDYPDNIVRGTAYLEIKTGEKDAEGNDIFQRVTSASIVFNRYNKDGQFKDEIYFYGLTPETTYYIRSVSLRVVEGEEGMQRHSLKTVPVDCSFTTTKCEKETTEITLYTDDIKVPVTDLKLNCGSYGEGIQYDTIYASVKEDEPSDIKWTVSVNALDGTAVPEGEIGDYVQCYGYYGMEIHAIKPCEVILTAEAVYGKAKAVCKVHVRNYKPYHVADGVDQAIVPGNAVTVYTGKAEKFKVYDYNVLPVREVSANATYTVIRGNATVKDNEITGTSAGISKVVAEYEGYKAAFDIKVKAPAQGIVVTGLQSTGYNVAVPTKDAYILASSNSYNILVKETPDLDYKLVDPTDYIWESDNEDIATVDETGKIELHKAAPQDVVTITITPKSGDFSPVQVKVISKAVPYTGEGYVVALSNLKQKKLGDVAVPAHAAPGFEWVNPKTTLDGLKAYTGSLPFAVKYTGEIYYPLETTVNVYYDTITGFVAKDNGENHVIQLATTGDFVDYLDLDYEIQWLKGGHSWYNGEIIVPDVKNIKQIDSETFAGLKTGSYTIKPVLYDAASNKKIMATSYKFTVVDEKLIGRIEVKKSDVNGVLVDNLITVDKQDYTLQAICYDRNGKVMDPEETKIDWKINNTNVATIKAGEGDTATVTGVAAGNAQIKVMSLDKAGVYSTISLRYMDYTPIIEHTNVTINLAYDYDTYVGENYAIKDGSYVTIAPANAYNDYIISAALYKDEACTQYATDCYLYNVDLYDAETVDYVVAPTGALKEGNYTYYLAVNTKMGGKKVEKLSVSVVTKFPVITAKMSRKANLFYSTDKAEVKFAIKKTPVNIKDARWIPSVSDNTVSGNRFDVLYTTNDAKGAGYAVMKQIYVDVVKNGKKYALKTPGIAEGKFEVLMDGYKLYAPVQNKKGNFKLGYVIKKPGVKAYVGKICSELDMNGSYIDLYDKYLKTYLYYDNTVRADVFELATIDNANINILTSYGNISNLGYYYTGNKKSDKGTLTLVSNNWKDALSTKISVKDIKAKAVLSPASILYNTNIGNGANTYIYIKGMSHIPAIESIKVDGANAKSADLLKKGVLEVGFATRDNINAIRVWKNYNIVSANGLNIKDGKYNFKITPTINGKTLKPLKLKVTITSKAPALQVKTSGKLDLLKYSDYNTFSSGMSFTYKVANVPTGAMLYGMYMTGDYASFFRTDIGFDGRYHIAFNGHAGDIKAGYAYKPSILASYYTADSREIFTAVSKPITIKPTQKNPKVKMDGQVVLYTNGTTSSSVDLIDGVATFKVPAGYGVKCYIGSERRYDLDKDGTDDVELYVVHTELANTYAVAGYVYNPDTVKAGSYKLPMDIVFYGADGISKNAKTTVQVVVK